MANIKTEPRKSSPASDAPVYTPTARRYHWWTVAFVFAMFPLGKAMDYRGNHLNIWDNTTNVLYSTHKVLGILLLVLVITRLVYRLRNGAPPDEPTLEPWQKLVSHLTHWGLYGLLIAMPLLGWLGVSLYGARDIFGLFNLPPLAAQNQEAAKFVFTLHGAGAMLLFLAIGAHIGAAIYHHVIRKDGVLRRMLPGIGTRKA
jgi:cytochrome b561